MTQEEKVLGYIKKYGSITSFEAFRDLGITRLSARIYTLRKHGVNIDNKMVSVYNRFGDECRVAKYFISLQGDK